jgi:hypothetical protein
MLNVGLATVERANQHAPIDAPSQDEAGIGGLKISKGQLTL